MNSVFLVGKVGKDPVVRQIGNKKTTLAEFSLATSKPPRERGGEWATTWHTIKAFGKAGDNVAANVRKGDTVAITNGELTYEEWEKEGVKHNRTSITVAPWDGIVVQMKSDPVNQEQRAADQDFNQEPNAEY
jgi:single-strand DNA-binding protein